MKEENKNEFKTGIKALKTTIPLKQIIASLSNESTLSFPYGLDMKSKIVTGSFDTISNMLVIGDNEHDKELFIDTLISTLIMRNSPIDLEMVLMNTKSSSLGMGKYKNIPYLRYPVASNRIARREVVKNVFDEMQNRYSLFEKYNVSNIDEYNRYCKAHGKTKLPVIIFVISDCIECVASNNENLYRLFNLLMKARAAGIHLIVGTNNKKFNLMGPVIRANTPAHILLDSSSKQCNLYLKSPFNSNDDLVKLTQAFISPKDVKKALDSMMK